LFLLASFIVKTQTYPQSALVVVVPKDKLTTTGPIKKWKGIADSGNAVYRWFCSECGSPIAHDPEAAPVIALKGGCLDSEQKKALKPVCCRRFPPIEELTLITKKKGH